MTSRPSCDKWRVRVSAYLDGEDPRPAEVGRHLAECGECRAWADSARVDARLVRRAFALDGGRPFVDAVMRGITVVGPMPARRRVGSWFQGERLAVAACAALVAAILAPVFIGVQVTARRQVCLANLRALSAATAAYAGDSGGVLPVADRWEGLVRPYVPGKAVFNCPAAYATPAYGYRADVAGQRFSDLPYPDLRPLLYDQDPHSGAFAPRHVGVGNVAYLDGHVRTERSLPYERPVKGRPQQDTPRNVPQHGPEAESTGSGVPMSALPRSGGTTGV